MTWRNRAAAVASSPPVDGPAQRAPAPASSTLPIPAPRHGPVLGVTAAAALALLLLGATAGGLWLAREAALRTQVRELTLLARVQADALERGLLGVELALLGVRLDFRGLDPAADGPRTRTLLSRRAALQPQVRGLQLRDARGRTWGTAVGDPGAAGGLAAVGPDGDAFLPPLAALRGDDIAIATPPAGASGPVVAALRLWSATGSAGGLDAGASGGTAWVLAEVPPLLLTDRLGRIDDGQPATRLSVHRSDGRWLAGDPLPTGGDGALVQTARLAGFPLAVTMSRPLAAALLDWRASARLAVSATAAALLLLLAVALPAWRAEQRRRQVDAAWARHRQRVQRLEAQGTLAAGVAHDVNNLLAVVQGYTEMALEHLAGSAAAGPLEQVLHAVARGRAMSERLMALGRGRPRHPEAFDLLALVDEVLALLAPGLPAGLQLQVQPPLRASLPPGGIGGTADGVGSPAGPPLPLPLLGDPTLVFQAVLNLCRNAVQAQPDGGVVRVAVGTVVLAQERLLSHGVLGPGRYAVLQVADRGGGIAPSVQGRLFEPYATNRATEGGTGLGLAVVQATAAAFDGAVDVRSRAGRGCVFVLWLRQADADAALQPPGRPGVPAVG